jgi:hypothetical protein
MTARRQIELFAAAVYSPAVVVEVRRLPSRRSTWHVAEELPALAGALARDNADQNIYVGVNPRLAIGRRGNGAVELARVVVADFDATDVDTARARIAAAGMPEPTLLIDSGHGAHAYWRLAEPLPAKLWREWQKDLAALLGSDPSVHNEERILRLPGFTTHKPPPAPCRVIECAAARTYDLCDLPIPPRPGTDTTAPVYRIRRETNDADTGDRFARCRAYLAKIPPAVSGQHGHTATWYAANTCNRFGLTKAEALELLTWYSETKCVPPWSEKEIGHKVDDAYRRNAGQHGSKLRVEVSIKTSTHRVFAVRRTAGAA